jgi:predicted site-specific integrase-resolvase
MTNTRPAVDPECRYNQQQAAAALQVDRRTVRRWELEGYISFNTHKASRRKFTTGKQILKCWEACYL